MCYVLRHHTAGSGISPIKALIESGDLEADKRSDVRLYYGTRDAAHTAYADRIPAWEAAGVKVIQVCEKAAALVCMVWTVSS
jgi:ferredoxin-NADP reductase